MTLNLSQEVLNRRTFNQNILNLHSTSYMLSRTPPFLSKDKIALDIGAAVGMYSSFWTKYCKFVYSYEAVPPIFTQLQNTAKSYDNMVPINVAMSDKVGTSKFFVDDKRLSNNSFTNLVGGQEIEVETTTIDNENHNNVGFIKVDVEGHELAVLRGGLETIERDRPVCMVEIYPKFNDGPIEDTFNFFFERNYNCFYNIRSNGLERVLDTEHGADIANDEKLLPDHDGDFLFVPEESRWL